MGDPPQIIDLSGIEWDFSIVNHSAHGKITTGTRTAAADQRLAYPLVSLQKAIEHGHREIVALLTKQGDFPWLI